MQLAKTVTDRSSSRAGRALAAAVLPAVAAMLIAGCGGGNKTPGIANVSASTSTTRTSSSSSTIGGGGTPAGFSSSSPSGRPGAHSQIGFALAPNGASRTALLRFVGCMRSHGVPDFPDPGANGVISGNSSEGLDPSSPQFQAASQKCRRYLGKGAAPSPAQQQQFKAQALEFSRCMRAHGISDFPDPNISGGHVSLQLKGGPGSDLDPQSPLFQRAQQACGSFLPGKPVSASSSS